MKKFILIFLVLFLLSPELIRADEEATSYLDLLDKKYSGLKDYTVDVNVHFDIESFKAPDMQGKLYYKAPDKMKVESKRVFFFPKDGGYLNHSLLRKEDFDIKLLEHLTYENRKAVKLRLTPKKTKGGTKDLVLTIDADHTLIREMNISQFGGREIKAIIKYGKFDSFELPTDIELQFDSPASEPTENKEFGPFMQGVKRATGKVEMTYSNYKVNVGLSDEIFTEIKNDKMR